MNIKNSLLRTILLLLAAFGTAAMDVNPASAAEPGAAAASLTSAGTTAATAAATPGATAITAVSSPAYNKIKLSWRKASGATHYFVYYRQEGAKKWTKIATVKSPQLSYTHVATKALPIEVGRKYLYTVRAYNFRSRLYGTYDKKGTPARTVPNKVALKSAVWNSAGTAVTVSWGKASGCDRYRVYRKTESSPKWKRIASVKTDVHEFVDKNPAAGEKNYYTVRTYYSKTKTGGKYHTGGILAVSQKEAELQQTAKLLSKTKTALKTSQIILVVDHNLSLWEKTAAGTWTRKLSAYCGYGSNGMSADRHEGDRTTPIGSFPILHAFGKVSNPGTTMQYKKITKNSYWSGEYSTYNQWVESPGRHVAGEHLIDYYQYKYAMAIGFNRNPTVYKKGSAIFLHCKSYDHWSTAGCVSVEEPVMKKLLLASRNGVYMIIVKSQKDITSW